MSKFKRLIRKAGLEDIKKTLLSAQKTDSMNYLDFYGVSGRSYTTPPAGVQDFPIFTLDQSFDKSDLEIIKHLVQTDAEVFNHLWKEYTNTNSTVDDSIIQQNIMLDLLTPNTLAVGLNTDGNLLKSYENQFSDDELIKLIQEKSKGVNVIADFFTKYLDTCVYDEVIFDYCQKNNLDVYELEKGDVESVKSIVNIFEQQDGFKFICDELQSWLGVDVLENDKITQYLKQGIMMWYSSGGSTYLVSKLRNALRSAAELQDEAAGKEKRYDKDSPDFEITGWKKGSHGSLYYEVINNKNLAVDEIGDVPESLQKELEKFVDEKLGKDQDYTGYVLSTHLNLDFILTGAASSAFFGEDEINNEKVQEVEKSIYSEKDPIKQYKLFEKYVSREDIMFYVLQDPEIIYHDKDGNEMGY